MVRSEADLLIYLPQSGPRVRPEEWSVLNGVRRPSELARVGWSISFQSRRMLGGSILRPMGELIVILTLTGSFLMEGELCRWRCCNICIIVIAVLFLTVVSIFFLARIRVALSSRTPRHGRSKCFTLEHHKRKNPKRVNHTNEKSEPSFPELTCYFYPKQRTWQVKSSLIPDGLCTHVLIAFAPVDSEFRVDVTGLGGIDEIKR